MMAAHKPVSRFPMKCVTRKSINAKERYNRILKIWLEMPGK
jgi:hypothetical protein